MTTKGLLGVASFGHGLSWMLYTKTKRAISGDPTPLPWSQPDRYADGTIIPDTYRLRKRILLSFVVRGFLEFCGSSFLLLALKIALDNDINQGISTAMMTLAGLMITLMSWCFYGEKLNWAHGLGMFLILGAVILMGVFEKTVSNEIEPAGGATDGQTSASSKEVIEVTIVGTLAALSFSFEAIQIKWLLN